MQTIKKTTTTKANIKTVVPPVNRRMIAGFKAARTRKFNAGKL